VRGSPDRSLVLVLALMPIPTRWEWPGRISSYPSRCSDRADRGELHRHAIVCVSGGCKFDNGGARNSDSRKQVLAAI